ncbi:unnamed protein product [Adineta ricciae]|uniref:Uncharacterized protein n=1 Tax=Adineta ricciae TaxID=249248 RepID=A0A815XA47_ADIRI|nr:unnamed protein product [Adineta ricciae]
MWISVFSIIAVLIILTIIIPTVTIKKKTKGTTITTGLMTITLETTKLSEITKEPITTEITLETTKLSQITKEPITTGLMTITLETTKLSEITKEPITTEITLETTKLSEITKEPITTGITLETTKLSEITKEPITTLTTTTTTTCLCNSTYTNETWNSTANRLAQWSFDGDYRDQMNNYNATPVNNMSFITTGYVRQGLRFVANTNSMLNIPHIPLVSTSFTIDMWIYITGLSNTLEHGLFGLCSAAASYRCLHLSIRQNDANYYLYFAFYNSDCTGVTSLMLNTWMHAAYVFDFTTLKQMIYLNGVSDTTCTASSYPTSSTTTGVTIGFIPLIATVFGNGTMSYFQGYMDQITVSNRTKSSCEVLEIATLVAHFTFDDGSFLQDSGPNSLDKATTQSTSSIPYGQYGQAIHFTGTTSSFFQVSGFTSLGTTNKPFSISLWIRPMSLQGVLVHVTRQLTGHCGWCIPFLAFTSNGSIFAEIWTGDSLVSVIGPKSAVSTLVWSHIVQTWSLNNGLRLYINNILVASDNISAKPFLASGTVNFITLANVFPGGLLYGHQAISMPYNGSMDDFRVYSRELSANDVNQLYNNSI